ncbi:hypothetical protein BB560_007046 [Smittium megazygosporum]|uniref:Pre-mRNA-splicing factor n=1 Tax=Smittium megazygosporum TaxID=133381 RepID=A0A2T9XZ42_9FUNG|nr:hypothetical protein BB560_007046 [Smittium megazygosporum]
MRGPKSTKYTKKPLSSSKDDLLSYLEKSSGIWNNPDPKFDKSFVENVSKLVFESENSINSSISTIDSLHVLEKYFWPIYSEDTSFPEFVILLSAILSYKYANLGFFFADWSKGFSESDSPKELEQSQLENFGILLKNVYHLLYDVLINDSQLSKNGIIKRQLLVKFISNCSYNWDIEVIRTNILDFVNITIWSNVLNKKSRKTLFEKTPILKKIWKLNEKKNKSSDQFRITSNLLHNLLLDFIKILYSIKFDDVDTEKELYCEILLELLINLLSQLPTRRFLNLLVSKAHLITFISNSPLIMKAGAKKLSLLYKSLKTLQVFPLDDFSGSPISDFDVESQHYQKIQRIQIKLISQFESNSIIKNLALTNIQKLSDNLLMTRELEKLDYLDLVKLYDLSLDHMPPFDNIDVEFNDEWKRNFVISALVEYFSIPKAQFKDILNLPIYPDESRIFETSFGSEDLSEEDALKTPFLQVIPLPKLNLQFLTFYDYLLRNFYLYRIESTFQIRQDIEDALSRLNPHTVDDSAGYDDSNTEVVFSGWSRMATTIEESSILEIKHPLVGENYPSEVLASISINLNQFTDDVRRDWCTSIKPLDVMFLICVKPGRPNAQFNNSHSNLEYNIRGCQIESLIGADGKKIDDMEIFLQTRENEKIVPKISSIRVTLDPVQYKMDLERGLTHIYSSFNILIRRKAKENNFKSVLSSIIQLMQSQNPVPTWIYNTLIGFGDPRLSSSEKELLNSDEFIPMNDTFLSASHLKNSFPGYGLIYNDELDTNDFHPRYSIKLTNDKDTGVCSVTVKPMNTASNSFNLLNRRRNSCLFTPTQVKATISALHKGLTTIVGPPGSGKTDVAVQIISNLYHNYPNQKILLITHSNQALNQLFEKIMNLEVDQRHLLRLGHGEENLASEESFSRAGRVDSFLERRIYLLSKVDELAKSLNIQGDFGYTCETAGYFFKSQILYRWNQFVSNLNTIGKDKDSFSREDFSRLFPFYNFVKDSENMELESEIDENLPFEDFLTKCTSLFQTIKEMFSELESIRPFELLRSYSDRSNYLLMNEARLVAMTCTHAALKKSEFAKLGFSFDTLIMEEAAQILEIESFIPLSLGSSSGQSRLKRVIMIGDHHQLPPVVKNTTLRSVCNFEQSMFTRFIRLGVPSINLDMQGRSRPQLADLYRWCYPGLGDLPHTKSGTEFTQSNAGFAFNFQAIDVEPLSHQGESEPSRFYYQNLVEAEYSVSIFQYMRLLGYPLNKIAILTTYNGQKNLILDILKLRCKSEIFGIPLVSTVDQFQGMQKEYIILSLVRTKSVGHIRDLRRLIVALSRARLGLYVVCRLSLFLECPETKYAFTLLSKNPKKLSIVENEQYPTSRDFEADCTKPETLKYTEFEGLDAFGDYVYQLSINKISESNTESPEIENQMDAEE